MTGPMDGMVVVEFGQYIAAPGAAALLASLGARVIKVEPLLGDSSRRVGAAGESMLRSCNRGKESLSLDLRDGRGLEAVKRLLDTADVVISNMRPGAMERLGIGADQVRSTNPRVVYASISGFGTSPTARMRAGLDIAAQAESGMMWINGEADGDPTRVGFAAVDAGAAHALAQGVLAALLQRERGGPAETVEVSLLHVAIHLQGPQWASYFLSGEGPSRKGNGQDAIAPAADLVRTRDGHIVLSAYTTEHWSQLCDLLGRPELVDDPRFSDNPRRVAHRTELLHVLGEGMSHLTTTECVQWLAQAGHVVGAVRSYPEIPGSQDVIDGEIFAYGTDRHGASERYVTSPYRLGGQVVDSSQPAPELGQHSVQVLAGLGYTADEVAELLCDGVVVAHDQPMTAAPSPAGSAAPN